ncbi:zinc-ribbon-domain-containing protein [Absidia repens]|uniref:Zinc-ribbon-domain-containing protein n=1 Tax=Absidia repens TaxID=90262 RepID=A0A1X2IPS4_9FUNG|nr:zinc-ribbon-domain-containing protein [Absidia repens]
MTTVNHHTFNMLHQKKLREQILEIHQNKSLCLKEKSIRMQSLMTHQHTIQSLPNPHHTLTALSNEKSYQDEEKNILGCPHYQRNVKIQADCCQKIFPCRHCHDENSDHAMVRSEIKNMLCMVCDTLQPAGQYCKTCNTRASRYYCHQCKFWNDSPDHPTYHCDACGICRQGKGIGIDFHHCEKCNVCLTMSAKDSHKCIERNLESDCPICGEYMFTSTTAVIVMVCGHGIHKTCYQQHIQNSYQCPICLKSLRDMTFYFRQLQNEMERQPMPLAYQNYRSLVFCNDCEQKSVAPYHFFHHRCQSCSSFNTTVLKTEIPDTAHYLPPL